MRRTIVIATGAVVFLLISAWASHAQAVKAATRSPSAKIRYSAAYNNARDEFDRSVEQARRVYVRDLEAELQQAMERKDLDSANAINEELKEAKKTAPAPTKAQIKVLESSYGVPGKTLDVTKQVAELVERGEPMQPFEKSFPLPNDPAFGQHKWLAVRLQIRGQTLFVSSRQGSGELTIRSE